MMTFMESFLMEIDQESVGTRKILALYPSGRLEWQPHPKSMTIKALATHIADIPRWISSALIVDGIDFQKNPYAPRDCNSAEELLAYYDENVEEAKANLKKYTDDVLNETWTLSSGDMVLMQLTRMGTIRHSLGQIVHHRAQMGVFLRLLDIPIPGVYGPSADEMS